MSLTEGLRIKVNNDLAVLGAGLLPGPEVAAPRLRRPRLAQVRASDADITREQGEALRGLPHVGHVSIEAYHQSRPERVATRERATKPNIDVLGRLARLRAGQRRHHRRRALLHRRRHRSWARRVAVIGADVADVLFPGGSALGQEIRVRSARPSRWWAWPSGGAARSGCESKDGCVLIPLDQPTQVRRAGCTNHNIAVAATSARGRASKAHGRGHRRGCAGCAACAEPQENDFDIFTNELGRPRRFDQLAAMVGAATFGGLRARAAGGRHRHHEHHAGLGDRADPRDRRAHGAGRAAPPHPRPVRHRGGHALAAGRAPRRAARAPAWRCWPARSGPVPASVPAWAVLLSLLSACGAGLRLRHLPRRPGLAASTRSRPCGPNRSRRRRRGQAEAQDAR